MYFRDFKIQYLWLGTIFFSFRNKFLVVVVLLYKKEQKVKIDIPPAPFNWDQYGIILISPQVNTGHSISGRVCRQCNHISNFTLNNIAEGYINNLK